MKGKWVNFLVLGCAEIRKRIGKNVGFSTISFAKIIKCQISDKKFREKLSGVFVRIIEMGRENVGCWARNFARAMGLVNVPEFSRKNLTREKFARLAVEVLA